MDKGVYELRDFRDLDYGAEARLWNELVPYRTHTPESLAHDDIAYFPPPLVHLKRVVEQRATGQVVAVGALHHDPESFDPNGFVLEVVVTPPHRHRGVGLAMVSALYREATARDARRLFADARTEDPRSIAFLERQGFVERRRSWRSQLTVEEATPVPDRTAALEADGIRFTTLEAEDPTRPETIDRLLDLARETAADEPRLGPYTPISREMFIDVELHHPDLIPEAYFLAKSGDRFVGHCVLFLVRGQPTVLHQGFTGTRREVRGRGVATELKRRAIDYARSRGVETINTSNDSLNRPMLAINAKLGFRRISGRVFGERIL